jgi:glycosyltransferase involved in cell wall biosynthesis
MILKGELLMKKRVVVIAEYFPPRLGADRRIFELMKRLASRYDIHFITLPPSYTLFIRKIGSYRAEQGHIRCEGMTGHSIALPKILLRLWANNFVLSFALTLAFLSLQMIKKIAQLKPEIIIVNNTSVYTGLLGFICSRILNKKLLVEYNDLEALYATDLVRNRVNGFLLPTLRRMLVLVEDVIVRHGWKVTAITEFIRNYASIRNTRKDVTVIPDGVDMDFFDANRISGEDTRLKHGVRPDETLCVYAGRIEDCAGANIILDAAKLLETDKNIKFMVVGEGDPKLVTELSECTNVILTGPIAKENVPEYLAAANIVLVPFPESIASHSISPLKLFEALAMDKPVVASAVSGIEEVVSEGFNGMLVSANPERWAAAVKELAKKCDGPKSKVEGNRIIVSRKYGWNHLAEAFNKVLED